MGEIRLRRVKSLRGEIRLDGGWVDFISPDGEAERFHQRRVAGDFTVSAANDFTVSG